MVGVDPSATLALSGCEQVRPAFLAPAARILNATKPSGRHGCKQMANRGGADLGVVVAGRVIRAGPTPRLIDGGNLAPSAPNER